MVCVAGFLFLEVSAVGRARCGIDGAVESVAHQCRDVSAVIQMGMGEDNGIDVRGTDLERYAVTVAKVFIALEQAALYKDPVAL